MMTKFLRFPLELFLGLQLVICSNPNLNASVGEVESLRNRINAIGLGFEKLESNLENISRTLDYSSDEVPRLANNFRTSSPEPLPKFSRKGTMDHLAHVDSVDPVSASPIAHAHRINAKTEIGHNRIVPFHVHRDFNDTSVQKEFFDISSNGIAIGNHILLNGWLHAGFHSLDNETPSNSMFSDYFSSENYLSFGMDLIANIKLGNFDIVTHYYPIYEGIHFVGHEYYAEYNFNDYLRLKFGRILSQRGYHSNVLPDRIIGSLDYHYMEKGFARFHGQLIDDVISQAIFDPLYRNISLSVSALSNEGSESDYNQWYEEFQSNMNEYYAVFGITKEDQDELADLKTWKDPVKLQQALDKFSAKFTQAIHDRILSKVLLSSNFRTNSSKGLQIEKDIENISFRLAFRDSIWSLVQNFDEGFGIDMGAVLYLNSSTSIGGSYAFEKISALKGMMTKFIPGTKDNIHQLNTYIEFKNDSLTTVLEFDYYMINPLDSQIWDAMLLTQYRFNNGFGLALRYTYEDISTSLGDGFSHSWTISPSYVINDYALIRAELRTDNAVLGTIPDDYNYMFALETLIDF
jgi:hypothetical protein